jgi:hypothetical protein
VDGPEKSTLPSAIAFTGVPTAEAKSNPLWNLRIFSIGWNRHPYGLEILGIGLSNGNLMPLVYQL